MHAHYKAQWFITPCEVGDTFAAFSQSIFIRYPSFIGAITTGPPPTFVIVDLFANSSSTKRRPRIPCGT